MSRHYTYTLINFYTRPSGTHAVFWHGLHNSRRYKLTLKQAMALADRVTSLASDGKMIVLPSFDGWTAITTTE